MDSKAIRFLKEFFKISYKCKKCEQYILEDSLNEHWRHCSQKETQADE